MRKCENICLPVLPGPSSVLYKKEVNQYPAYILKILKTKEVICLLLPALSAEGVDGGLKAKSEYLHYNILADMVI